MSEKTDKAGSSRDPQREHLCAAEYVLVSLKHTRPRDRYVTFWRPNAAGYCWPLSWAGRYTLDEALEHSDDNPGEETFPVPVAAAYRLSRAPVPGYIDSDAGPVVTKRRIAALRAAALAQPTPCEAPQVEREGSREEQNPTVTERGDEM